MSFFHHLLSRFDHFDTGRDGFLGLPDLWSVMRQPGLSSDDAAAVAVVRWLLPPHRPGWDRHLLERFEAERARGEGAAGDWARRFDETRQLLADPALNRDLTRSDDSADWWQAIHQGKQNDCWFVSALIGLARHRPDELRRLVHPNPSSGFDVTFPGHRTVSGLTVSDAEIACYRPAHFRGDGVLLPLFEKAYGLLTHRRAPAPLEVINAPAIRAGRSIRLLTGHGTRVYPLTRSPFGWWKRVVARRMREAATANPPRLMTVSNTNFRTGHVFAVVACDVDADAITLKDPYSADVLPPRTLDELMRDFAFLFVESRGEDGGFF